MVKVGFPLRHSTAAYDAGFSQGPEGVRSAKGKAPSEQHIEIDGKTRLDNVWYLDSPLNFVGE